MKKILLLSTGGTIASASGEDGLVPKLTGEQMIKLIPELEGLCEIDCKEIMNLDSTNVQPEEWVNIAREAFEGLKEYDGIVITHGTDTMAYSSSALSFMLRNLNKPVIFTGSQLPIEHPQTDGKRNILDAFKVAVSGLAGVYIVFDGKIIKGVRSSKVRTQGFDAFKSINYPYIGRVENGEVIIEHNVDKVPEGQIELDDKLDPRVLLLKLTPGFLPEVIPAVLKLGFRGLIIEGFGLGGVPNFRRNIIPEIEKALKEGIAVVVTTQCLLDGSDLTVYEVGVKALKAGVIPAYDMTTETIVTKLMWALGHTYKLEEVRKIMMTNYAGEFSIIKNH
ncbi:asparaginase [Thermovenabulum gondwanense]|uniref:asparaginase n=1 Tax=Thermovenabulum gondwanense TaxID=520767 RepID=A0A161RFK4_9FIRM|nr:asparaginase [Thermovenabulum gondwanense]KYO69612.1 L-asparaginase 1 [Thermovenabulum gondwanense]